MSALDTVFAPLSEEGKGSGLRYLQLRQRLDSAIRAGELPEGPPLPPEREIAARTGLSRVTVRKAVSPLVEAGLIVQRRGSGTRVGVVQAKVEQSLSRLTSFTQDMALRGMTATSQILSRGVFAPSPEEVMALALRPSDQVARISRLRIADGRPLAIENASVPALMLPGAELVEDSLYRALQQRGFRPVRAVQRITATILTPSDAQLLGTPAGSAGLSITRRAFLASGQAVEHTRSLYRADAYDFVAELQIPEAPA